MSSLLHFFVRDMQVEVPEGTVLYFNPLVPLNFNAPNKGKALWILPNPSYQIGFKLCSDGLLALNIKA